jgi:hypothetical protein
MAPGSNIAYCLEAGKRVGQKAVFAGITIYIAINSMIALF